jgi:hypothetical protein
MNFPYSEIYAAGLSSLIISPFVSYIDLATIRSQRLQQSLLTSLQHYKREPVIKLANPFIVMFGVYFATYATANCSSENKVFNTTLVNLAAINWKDFYYSKLQHAEKPKKTYSAGVSASLVRSQILFLLRDFVTVFANFAIKPIVVKQSGGDVKSNFMASFTLPIAVQFLNTPLHILAVQSGKLCKTSCLLNIKQNYKQVLMGRILRTIPAFCVGGFLNDYLLSLHYG